MPIEAPDRRARVGVIGSYAKALVMTADRIPVAGETLLGRDYRQTFGGKGSDMAVQAARLGASVAFVGVVGDDAFGVEFASLMSDERVDISHLRVSDQQPTGVGFIVKDEQGTNVIVVDMGANRLFGRQDIDDARELLAGCDVVLAQLEIPLDTALYGLAVAKERGAQTILNPAPAVDLRSHDLSTVDVLTPNQTEARLLLGLPPDDGRDDAEIAEALLAQGASAVVVTRGGEGATLFETPAASGGTVGTARTTSIAPVQVAVLDSNGAGDSFNAALAVAVAEGKGVADAAVFAAAVAGLCCEHWETVPSYQTRATVDAFLEAGVSATQDVRDENRPRLASP
jgi:ribokinase